MREHPVVERADGSRRAAVRGRRQGEGYGPGLVCVDLNGDGPDLVLVLVLSASTTLAPLSVKAWSRILRKLPFFGSILQLYPLGLPLCGFYSRPSSYLRCVSNALKAWQFGLLRFFVMFGSAGICASSTVGLCVPVCSNSGQDSVVL